MTGVKEDPDGMVGDAKASILTTAGDDGTLISSSEVMLAIDFSRASSDGSVLTMATSGISGLLTSGCSFFTPPANAA